MGFIGPNGAGKTITIKSILNMICYDSGEIYFFGRPSKFAVMENIGVVTDISTMYEGEWRINDIEKIIRIY